MPNKFDTWMNVPMNRRRVAALAPVIVMMIEFIFGGLVGHSAQTVAIITTVLLCASLLGQIVILTGDIIIAELRKRDGVNR